MVVPWNTLGSNTEDSTPTMNGVSSAAPMAKPMGRGARMLAQVTGQSMSDVSSPIKSNGHATETPKSETLDFSAVPSTFQREERPARQRKPQAKVFNIPEGTDNEELKSFFSEKGHNVQFMKILPCRDGKTTTLGFAEFDTDDEVDKLVKELSNVDFNGSELRIMTNNRDGGGGGGGSFGNQGGGGQRFQCKVFNIADGTEQSEIQELFSSMGPIKSVKILPCQAGKDVTLGFVEFEDAESMKKAIDEMHQTEFKGNNLNVRPAAPPAASNGGGFSGFGESSSGFGTQNGSSGFGMQNGSSGFGSANSFGQNGDERPPRGMGRGASLSSNAAGGGGRQRGPQAKVFGFPEGTQQEEVREFFASAGNIKFVKILPLREGKDTHLGFVEFETDEEVQKAVNLFDGQDFNGSNLKVMPGAPPSSGNASSFGDSSSFGNASSFGTASTFGNASSFGQQGSAFPAPTGRMPRENGDFGSSDNKGCYRCGEVGHISNACPNGGAKSMSCFRCGEPGHLSRDCPTSSGPGGSRMGPDGMGPDQFSSDACRRCGESGHWSRECVNAPITDGAMAVTYIPPPPPETEEEIFKQGIHQGINFEKYDGIPVEITGTNPVQGISKFEDAALHESCFKNIKRSDWHVPTPVQKYAIPALLKGRDLMACAQTGSGKTAAFLLPIITNLLNRGLPSSDYHEGAATPLAAILAPTRELAVQIFMEIRKFAFGTPIKPVVVYGGVSVNHQTDRLRMGCHILVATPGRLDDFVKKGKISFSNLQFLVFDEADRMLDMGFGPQISQIIDNSEMPPKTERCTLMFSATFPEDVQKMAAAFLHDYLFLTVGRVGGVCSDVQQKMIEVPGSTKRTKLEEILQESGSDRTLVFVERKRDADFLASFLSQRNYPTTSLNGDRSQQERELALADFRAGKAPVMVATAVAGRGLDIDDVKHVINYDLPNDTTEYVHRIGRTGRIGNKGMATSFFDRDRDAHLARGLVKLLTDGEQEVPDWLEDAALQAIGTGYGPAGGQFSSRDRRQRFEGDSGRGSSRAPPQAPPSSHANPPVAGLADEEDEEW